MKHPLLGLACITMLLAWDAIDAEIKGIKAACPTTPDGKPRPVTNKEQKEWEDKETFKNEFGYTLVQEIGRGMTNIAYRVLNEANNEVVLKVGPCGTLSDEAVKTAAIHKVHPSIMVEIYEHRRSNGEAKWDLIVMELLGSSIEDVRTLAKCMAACASGTNSFNRKCFEMKHKKAAPPIAAFASGDEQAIKFVNCLKGKQTFKDAFEALKAEFESRIKGTDLGKECTIPGDHDHKDAGMLQPLKKRDEKFFGTDM